MGINETLKHVPTDSTKYENRSNTHGRILYPSSHLLLLIEAATPLLLVDADVEVLRLGEVHQHEHDVDQLSGRRRQIGARSQFQSCLARARDVSSRVDNARRKSLLGWITLGWVTLRWIALGWITLGWIILGWVILGWVTLLGWIALSGYIPTWNLEWRQLSTLGRW